MEDAKVNLNIQQKTEDMILYGNQALKQFPKSERYAMAAEIKQSMYTFYRLIITANLKYTKRPRSRKRTWNWKFCADS